MTKTVKRTMVDDASVIVRVVWSGRDVGIDCLTPRRVKVQYVYDDTVLLRRS